MKVIVVEGCDNTGKDSLINGIANYYGQKHVKLFHAGVPKSDNIYQYYHDGLLKSTLDHYFEYDKYDALIHNRSMYGEYVYGPKYRNRNKDDTVKTIMNLETGMLRTYIRESELYFILLTSDDPDVIVNNDDGLSHSAKREDIIDEMNSFDEIFNMSNIVHKKRVLINDGKSFRNKETILEEVLDFVDSIQDM